MESRVDKIHREIKRLNEQAVILHSIQAQSGLAQNISGGSAIAHVTDVLFPSSSSSTTASSSIKKEAGGRKGKASSSDLLLNKAFLANTIRSVAAHNRREEIDASWRQHELQQTLRRDEAEEDGDGSTRRKSNNRDPAKFITSSSSLSSSSSSSSSSCSISFSPSSNSAPRSNRESRSRPGRAPGATADASPTGCARGMRPSGKNNRDLGNNKVHAENGGGACSGGSSRGNDERQRGIDSHTEQRALWAQKKAAAVAAMTADAEYRKRAAAALAAYSDGSLGSSYIPLPSSDSSDSDESAESNVSSDSPNSKNSACDAPFKTHEDSYGSSNDSYHEKSRPDHGRKRKKEKDSDIYSDRKRHKKRKDEKKKKKKTKKMKTKKKKSSNHGRNREHEPRDPTEKYRESQKKSMKES